MKTKTKHILGYSGTAVVALIIGTAAGSGGASDSAIPAVTSTVRTTATLSEPTPARPADAVTTTARAQAVTKTATKTVHAPTVTKTVTAQPQPKASIPGDGTYEVGTDIQPGTYVSSAPDSGNCYWARLSGTSGSFSDIIANNNSSGQSVVTIAPTDKVFETSGCNDWTRR